MLGGILAGISVAQGIFGAVSSSNSASDQRAQARKRAKDLEEMANKEYNFNTKETYREFEQTLHSLYRDNAKQVFDFSNQMKKVQSEILRVNQKNTMGNVFSSSFKEDSEGIIGSQYLEFVEDSAKSLDYNANELVHSYNTNIEQLGINREKMMKDIQNSVGLAHLNANNTQAQGISQGLNSLTEAFATYKYWN